MVADVLNHLDKHLLPILLFRAAGWPYQPVIAQSIDKCQSRFLAPLLACKINNDELVGDFVRRRCRMSTTFCQLHGRWSLKRAQAVANWHGHCERNSSTYIWHSLIAPLRDDEWLRERRSQHVPRFTICARGWNTEAGRTKTRARRGQPAVRWHAGIMSTNEALQNVKRETNMARVTRKRDKRQKLSVTIK